MHLILSFFAIALAGPVTLSPLPDTQLATRQASSFSSTSTTTEVTTVQKSFTSVAKTFQDGATRVQACETREEAYTYIQTMYKEQISTQNFAFSGCGSCSSAATDTAFVQSYKSVFTSYEHLLQVTNEHFPNDLAYFKGCYAQYATFMQQTCSFGVTYKFDFQTVLSGVHLDIFTKFGFALGSIIKGLGGIVTGLLSGLLGGL